MPFSRSRSLTLALPPEQYACLERLARASGRSVAAVARELCTQGLAPSDGGRRVVVELEPAEAGAAERLARGYGLDLAGLFQRVAAGMGKAPGFVAGHLLRHLPGRPLPGPDARG